MSARYPELMFPSDGIRLKHSGETDYIYDPIRKKWLVLTPEEWVRQHLVHHLHEELNYPLSSIAAEKVVPINGMPKRFDLLVFVKGNPAILVECKAPDVELSEEVFHQACRYNTRLKAPIAVLFNGHRLITALIDTTSGAIHFLRDIPKRSHWDSSQT